MRLRGARVCSAEQTSKRRGDDAEARGATVSATVVVNGEEQTRDVDVIVLLERVVTN
jgi:hypothetical protein